MPRTFYSRSDIVGTISMHNMQITDTLDQIKRALSAYGKDAQLVEWENEVEELLNTLKSKANTYEKVFKIRPLQ